jgi:hypothetical protein
LVVDGYQGGTGIRNAIEGGYINLDTLKLTTDFVSNIKQWVSDYADLSYTGYEDQAVQQQLDERGIELTKELQNLLGPEYKVQYYSDGFSKELYFPQ